MPKSVEDDKTPKYSQLNDELNNNNGDHAKVRKSWS